MLEIHPRDVVVFRGGIKTREDEETLFNGGNISSVGHQNSGLRLRTWLIGILGFLVASLLFINSFVNGRFRITHFINAIAIRDDIADDPERLLGQQISGYLVNNAGCRIAGFDPLDSISRRYMHAEDPIECENGDREPLIESNDTAIYVNPVAQYLYYKKSETPDCCWRSFTRKADEDNAVTYEDVCHRFKYSAITDAEFVKVECFQEDKRIYRDYHALVPLKNKTEKRCRDAEITSKKRLSLLIVGLDSISRLNFHRMMPKTVKTLKKLDAIELLGYNKVADNTYLNLVPVLSGLSAEELESECLKNKKIPYDDCPLVWKNFSEYGYRTIFAEDACEMTIFNFLKQGFRNSPTDYYLRPYCIAAEGDIGNNHKSNANLCLGGRKNFENLLRYTRKVAEKFANDRYFAFFWQASLSHDYLNYPQLGDEAYSNFFQHLDDNNLLNDTALVVMSDHGMRWGKYLRTYHGRMEASLPFVFIVLPAWWKEKYSTAVANLRKNVVSLTTPYDLHETILDILMVENISEESMLARNRAINSGNVTRGISLFASIPNHRTCSMAGIPEHWCMCHTSNKVSINDTRVKNTTRYLINELNRLVKNYPQCSVLKLMRLMDAKMWIGRRDDTMSKEKKVAPWIDYTITIETEPGGAIFEASIRNNETSNKLIGSISRLNAYGKQSSCVDDFNTRLYCYCY